MKKTMTERKGLFRRRRLGILLGIICLIMAVLIGTAKKKAHQALVSLEGSNDPYLSYEAWISIHEPEFQNSGDAQSAYYKYAEEHYSPEYREAQKKLALYRAGEIISLLIGVTLLIRQIYLFRQYCLKRQHIRSPPAQAFCTGGTADESKSLQFFLCELCRNFLKNRQKF